MTEGRDDVFNVALPKTSFLKKIYYRMINKKTPEEKLLRKIEILKELIEVKKKAEAKIPSEYVQNVMDDFYLDSVIVTKADGSVVMANEKGAFEKAVKNSSLYEFIKSEFPKAKMLMVKDDDKYNVVYRHGDLLFLMQTSGEISVAEVRAVVKKLTKGLEKFPKVSNKINKSPEVVSVQ